MEQQNLQQELEQEIAGLEARLAEMEERLPTHSVPPAMLMEIEEIEEHLALAKARLVAERHTDGGKP